MSTINAWAAPSAAAPLEPFRYDARPLHDDAVEIAVEACGPLPFGSFHAG